MDSEYSYSDTISISRSYSDTSDTPRLSLGFDDEAMQNNTSYKRFFTFLGMDLARWLSSWAFWANIIVVEALSLLFAFFSIASPPEGSTNRSLTVDTLSLSMVYVDLAIVILAGLIVGKDYSYKFAIPLKTMFKYPLSLMGARLCVMSIVVSIYSLLLNGILWLSIQGMMYAYHRTFDSPISWWHYLLTSILFSVFFALCCAGITIIFRSAIAGIVFCYIVIAILPMLTRLIPDESIKLRIQSFIIAQVQLVAMQFASIPSGAIKLTYWENVGVGALWAAVFIGLACLAVVFWKNRGISFFSRKRRKKLPANS